MEREEERGVAPVIERKREREWASEEEPLFVKVGVKLESIDLFVLEFACIYFR